MNTKDTAAIVANYAPDIFVFDAVPPRQYVGRAAMLKNWQDALAPFPGPMSAQMSDAVVSTEGAIGYAHYVIHAQSVDSSGGKFDATIRFTDVYRKIDGHWLIVQEHVSYPVDPTTGKADFNSKP